MKRVSGVHAFSIRYISRSSDCAYDFTVGNMTAIWDSNLGEFVIVKTASLLANMPNGAARNNNGVRNLLALSFAGKDLDSWHDAWLVAGIAKLAMEILTEHFKPHIDAEL